MKYEMVRLYDASRYEGMGIICCLEREELLEVGDSLVPRPEEYSHELQRELLTGVVGYVGRKGDYSNPYYEDADYRIGLEGVVDVAELSRKYQISEDTILSVFLHLSSEARDNILAQHPGESRILDEILFTVDRGDIGLLWFSGGDLIVYDYRYGDTLITKSPGLGARYGRAGANDFLRTLRRIQENRSGQLTLNDVIEALNAIGDWDHYHYTED